MNVFTASRTRPQPSYRSTELRTELIDDKKGSLVVLLPRGESLRNFVHTGALSRAGEHINLSILSAVTNYQIVQNLRDRFPRVSTLTEAYETWPVRFQRELIDIAHGRWVWSQAAQLRWRIRDGEAISSTQKVKRKGKKALGSIFASRTGISVLSRAERFTSRLLSNSTEYLRAFEELKPTLVFNSSHIHSRNAIQAVQAAQWRGIPTATFIFSWDNLTSQGRIILPYDYFLVWSEKLKVQLLEMYEWIAPENVFVTGSPQFDFHFRPEFYQTREQFCQQIGANPDRPIVFYATGMPNHMPGEPSIVEGIADILNSFPAARRPQLLVRVYAKDRSDRFEDLKKRRPDILFPEVAWEREWLTPMPDDSYALVNTLRHCAVGINVASTVSLELCMFDKPVINIGYNPSGIDTSLVSYADYYEFDHYKPVVDSGAVSLAKDEREVRSMLQAALREPSVQSSARKRLIEDMFGKTLDGKSAERVAKVLIELSSPEK